MSLLKLDYRYGIIIFAILAVVVILLVLVHNTGINMEMSTSNLYLIRSKKTGLYLSENNNLLTVEGEEEDVSTVWLFVTYKPANSVLVLQNATTGNTVGLLDTKLVMVPQSQSTFLTFTYRPLGMVSISVNIGNTLQYLTVVGTQIALQVEDSGDDQLFECIAL